MRDSETREKLDRDISEGECIKAIRELKGGGSCRRSDYKRVVERGGGPSCGRQ